jgi:hypothetical protein
LGDAYRRIFWRHKWKHPDNGNPYRRTCTVCGEQQEWDNGVPYETTRSQYYWTVWNEGERSKHFESPNAEITGSEAVRVD